VADLKDVVADDNAGAVADLKDKPAAMLNMNAISDFQGKLHASPDSREKAPDLQDKHPDLQDKQPAADYDTRPPMILHTYTVVDSQETPPNMSNRDAAAEANIRSVTESGTSMTHGPVNEDTTTNMGAGVAIGENSPFDIDGATTTEREDTEDISNVEDDGNHYDNDGDESTIPDDGTEDDQVLDAAIPHKIPSRPTEPDPDVAKIYKRKSLPWLYINIVVISIVWDG
jgi:hypothetical protein